MRVFISYSTLDFEVASEFATLLKQLGIEVWFAPKSMRAGRFPSQLAATIANADLVLLLASKGAQDSHWVEKEVAFAQALGRIILPVIIQDFNPISGLGLMIADLNNIRAQKRQIADLMPEILEALRGVRRNGRIIASFNVKGGVGKTVLAANLAAAFALRGNVARVLLVDLDPQYNLSQLFFDDDTIDKHQEQGKSVLSLFQGKMSSEAAGLELVVSLNQMNPPPGFSQRSDLLLGSDSIFDYAVDIRSEKEKAAARDNVFKFFTRARDLYDLIVIDVNPSVSFPTLCALDVTDHIVAPVRPDRFALRGLDLLQAVVKAHRDWPPKQEDFTVVLNEVAKVNGEKRLRMRDEASRGVRCDEFFGPCLVDDTIPYSSALTAPLIEDAASYPLKEGTVFGRDVGGTNLRMLMQSVAKAIGSRAGVEAVWTND